MLLLPPGFFIVSIIHVLQNHYYSLILLNLSIATSLQNFTLLLSSFIPCFGTSEVFLYACLFNGLGSWLRLGIFLQFELESLGSFIYNFVSLNILTHRFQSQV
jgi:hypothetical protein